MILLMKSFAVKNGSHGTVGNTDIEEWVKELCFFLIDQKKTEMLLHAPSDVLNTDKSGLPAVCFCFSRFRTGKPEMRSFICSQTPDVACEMIYIHYLIKNQHCCTTEPEIYEYGFFVKALL